MNIVLLGYGSIGKYYLKLLKKYKFNNIYIIDTKISKDKFPKGVYFSDFKSFKKKKIKTNYAIICTPSYNHYEQAKFFIKNNTNVLIEKPFVLKYSDGLKLINLVKRKKLKCWTVFQNRLNSSIKISKKLINKDFFGKINLIDCKLTWHRDKKYYQSLWRGKYSTDGGVLVNQSIHLLDILNYLFGEVRNFNGNIHYNKEKLEAEDYISLNINLKNNIPVTFLATTRANKDYEMSIDIFGSRNRLKISGIALNSLNFFDSKLNSKYKKFSFKTKNGYGVSHNELLKYFLSPMKNDIFNLSIEKNIYLIKLINSIYSNLIDSNKLHSVNKTKSLLGNEKK